MADVKWIKIVTDIFDNRKIRQIESLPEGDAIIVIWLKLLCLAGNINDYGMIYFTKEIPYTEQMLSTLFNRPLTTVQMAMKVFEQFGMIAVVNDIMHISNWEKYQNVDGMEKIREQNRIRQARFKEKQKLLLSNVTDNVTVTQGNATDKDIDKEIDIDKDNKNIGDSGESQPAGKPKRTVFVPPSVEEVHEYCCERMNNVDAEAFVDFYSSKGWMVGKNKMKDWKAAVRTWEKGRNTQKTYTSKEEAIRNRVSSVDDW